MTASVRSALSAGLAAGLVTAGAAAVLTVPVPTVPTIASPAVELSAFVSASVGGPTTSPGDLIINAYYAVQPWVQWGFEVGEWAVGFLPWPANYLAGQVDIAYSFWQPLTEAVVFSFAFLVDGQFDLIGPTLTGGVQTAVNNLVAGEINWFLGFLPPLPPLPPLSFPSLPAFPGAAVATTRSAPPIRRAAPARAVAPAIAVSEVPASPATPIESLDVAGPAAPLETPVAAEVPDTAVAVETPQPRRQAGRATMRAPRTVAAVPTAAAAVSEKGPAPRSVAAARSGADTSATRAPRVAHSAR